MEPRRQAHQLLAQAEALILDFDGPVCNVFAGVDAPSVAARLAGRFTPGADTDDPLAVLQAVIAADGDVLSADRYLTELEHEALTAAPITPGAREVIESSPCPVAIASNNGSEPIKQWLMANGLDIAIAQVEGRDPLRMKPDPRSINAAVRALGVSAARSVFVGDSASDCHAARAAGVIFIALADKTHKRRLFNDLGCVTIIDAMSQLTSVQFIRSQRS